MSGYKGMNKGKAFKAKEVTWIVNENGCWICTSHAPSYHGYPRITRNYKEMLLSRYMYEKFVAKIPNGLCVLHKCDIPMCINPEHLFIGTKADNNMDKLRKGRESHYGPSFPGEKHPEAKLTNKQAMEIIAIRGLSHEEIAKLYGVDDSTIWGIRSGHTWKHLKREEAICQ